MMLVIEHPGRGTSLARVATGWVFFANGAALGSWVPHIPDAKHALGLSDSVLGFALLGMAVGSLVGLPISGVLTSRFGSRKTATLQFSRCYSRPRCHSRRRTCHCS